MGVKKILFERRWRGGQSVDSPECEFKRSRGSREGFGQSFHRMKVASRKIIWTKLSSDEFTYANATPRYSYNHTVLWRVSCNLLYSWSRSMLCSWKYM